MSPYQEQARLIKALAHPARLRILDVLSQGEACVCHLTAILKRRQPYVSQHLMILREARLVQDRKEGTLIYYRLAQEHAARILALTREMLRAGGIGDDFPPVPASPLEGCSCPRCNSD